jgi:hypothetical protein
MDSCDRPPNFAGFGDCQISLNGIFLALETSLNCLHYHFVPVRKSLDLIVLKFCGWPHAHIMPSRSVIGKFRNSLPTNGLQVLCKVKVNVRPLATLDIFCCRAHEQVAMY